MSGEDSSFTRLEQRSKAAKERIADKKKIPLEDPDDNENLEEQLELPLELLGRGARGAPDSMLRSALFSATRPGKRKHLDEEPIASVANVSIRQTGPQLQQIDLDVWLELVRLAAESQSTKIEVPLKTLLRRIGRAPGKNTRARFLSTLIRLNATVVSISDGTREYNGSLIYEHSRDESTQFLVVRLNPRIAALFDNSGWSHLQLEQRHRLKRQPLAQWLHGYYSSHNKAYPIRIDTLRRLSGSTARTLYHFRAELRSSMDKVAEVTDWGWSIDDQDKLHVTKSQNCE